VMRTVRGRRQHFGQSNLHIHGHCLRAAVDAQIVERIELRVMLSKSIGNERLKWNIFVANKSL
jgi:hypothetical protein